MAACGRTPAPSVIGAPAPSAPPELVSVAKRVLPAVVSIYALKSEPPPTLSEVFHSSLGLYDGLVFYVESRFKPKYIESGTGSGFIINKRGYIITNNHVVAGANRIIVRIAHRGETEEDAQMLGSDPATDVALLKIGADYRHQVLPLGDSSTLQQGEWIAAIGNPYGVGKTFTAGVVSAVHRDDLGILVMEDFIQTDVSTSLGNSGGPLVNAKGEAVGINTLIQRGAPGIGFAVPINIATSIMAPLAAGQRILRGSLGLSAQDITPEAARHLRMENTDGALVTKIQRGGPALIADILPNDVITAFNGKKIVNAAQLKKEELSLPAGARVKLSIYRERKTLTVKATLAEAKPKR